MYLINRSTNGTAYGGYFPQPLHSESVKTKNEDPDYTRFWAEYVYSGLWNGRSAYSTDDYDRFMLNILYANGEQDSEQYFNRLITDDKSRQHAEDKRKAWFNISKDIIPILPKYKRKWMAIMEATEHTVQLFATDERSGAERESKTWAMKYDMEFGAMEDEIYKSMGVQPPQRGFVPQSDDELQMYRNMGGIKLPIEVVLEKLVGNTYSESEIKVIKRRFFNDIYDNNTCGCKDYVDRVTGRAMVRYVDYTNAIIERTDEEFCQNATYFGEVVPYTIQELMDYEELKGQGLDEKAFIGMAQEYGGRYGNPMWMNQYADKTPKSNSYPYRQYRIPVLDFEYLTTDTYNMTTTKDKYGNGNYVYESKKSYNTDKKKTQALDLQVWRRGKWILGTTYAFDFGLQYDQVKPKGNVSLSSFHFYVGQDKSIAESAIANVNEFQIAWMKLQNALNNSVDSGYDYDFGQMKNVMLGGKKMELSDLIRFHRQTGNNISNSINHNQQQINTNRPAVMRLEGGMGNVLNEYLQLMNFNEVMIQKVSGMTDQSTPTTDQGLGVTEIAINSMNENIRTYYNAYIILKEKITYNICTRLQNLLCEDWGKEAYRGVIGEEYIDIINQLDRNNLRTFGIHVVALPTQQEINEIKGWIAAGLQGGKNGTPALSFSDAFAIERILMSGGSLKDGQILLAAREESTRVKNLQGAAQNQQLNNQQMQQMEAIKSQNEAKIKQVDSQLKIQEEINKQQEDRKTILFKAIVDRMLATGQDVSPDMFKDLEARIDAQVKQSMSQMQPQQTQGQEQPQEAMV